MPVVEFLADELLEDEAEGFLPDDAVVEEAPEAAVGFAGPSDPPPRARGHASLAPDSQLPASRAAVAGTPGRVSRWIPTLTAAAFGFVSVALALHVRTRSEARVEPPPAAPPALAASAASSIPVAPPVVVASTPLAPTPASQRAPDGLNATDAKQASQKALDHGKIAQAILLGEQSVQLDATDADAWLILGAAYLQRGAIKEAHRCFSTCMKEATHGARGECRALSR